MHPTQRAAAEVPAAPDVPAPAAEPGITTQGELNLITPPPDAGRDTH
jgi:hypothetical protein